MKRRLAFALTAILATGVGLATAPTASADQIDDSWPTLTNLYDAYAPSVLRDGNNWRMWFGGWPTAADKPDDKIYYSSSTDGGHTWTPHTLALEIPGIAINDASVIKVKEHGTNADKYLMYFTYSNYNTPDRKNVTGLATSPDGLTWTNQGVVIGYANGWDNNGAWAPSAMAADPYGDTVYLWYFTDARLDPDDIQGFGNASVLRSTMTNGGTTLSSTVNVIPADGQTRVNPDVSRDPGTGIYWMFTNNVFDPPGEPSFTYDTEKYWSLDGVKWNLSRYSPIQMYNAATTTTPHAVWTGPGAYILLNGLSPGAGALLDFHSIQAATYKVQPELTVSALNASSAHSWNFQVSNARDGDPKTAWSSVALAGPTSTTPQFLSADLGTVKPVYSVTLTPRIVNGVANGFPTTFKIQTGTAGGVFTDVPGLTFTNRPNAGTLPQVFNFNTVIHARYVRVSATGFGVDIYNNYVMQFAEIAADWVDTVDPPIQGTDSSGFATPFMTSEEAADGNDATFWSSPGMGYATGGSQYLTVDLGVQRPVTGIGLTPRLYQGKITCFPKNFSIEWSDDNLTWATVPGETYTNYSPTFGTEWLNFSAPISARWFRVVATSFRPDPFNNYYFQVAEIYPRFDY